VVARHGEVVAKPVTEARDINKEHKHIRLNKLNKLLQASGDKK